jgi:hypothetical protein
MSSDENIQDLFFSSLSASVSEFDDAIPFEIGEGGYTEFDTISPEDILMSNYTNEPVFRCATLLAPAPAPDAFEAHLDEPREYILERPTLKKQASSSYSISDLSAPSSSKVASAFGVQSCGGVIVPEIPLLLMPTHFEVEMDIESITMKITETLSSITGVSYEHKKDNFEV